MNLNSIIYNLIKCFGAEQLYHSRVSTYLFTKVIIGRCSVNNRFHGINQHSHIGKHKLNPLEMAYSLVELHSFLSKFRRKLKKFFSCSNTCSAKAQTSCIKSFHSNKKTASFSANNILFGNTYIIKCNSIRGTSSYSHLLFSRTRMISRCFSFYYKSTDTLIGSCKNRDNICNSAVCYPYLIAINYPFITIQSCCGFQIKRI